MGCLALMSPMRNEICRVVNDAAVATRRHSRGRWKDPYMRLEECTRKSGRRGVWGYRRGGRLAA